MATRAASPTHGVGAFGMVALLGAEGRWRVRWGGSDLMAGVRGVAEGVAALHFAEAGSPSDADILCRFARGWILLARGDLPGALADAAAPDWAGPLAHVLHARGRGAELSARLAEAPIPTPWLQAAAAVAAGAFDRAADLYAEIGSRPDEALARLRATRARSLGGGPGG
jgi:hypothetical protein